MTIYLENKWVWQIYNFCTVFLASFPDVQTTEDGVLSVNSRYMTIKSLTFFYFSNLLACSSLSFAGTVMLLISTWVYSNPSARLKLPEKARSSLKYPHFQDGDHKTFSSSSNNYKQFEIICFWHPQTQKLFWGTQIWP